MGRPRMDKGPLKALLLSDGRPGHYQRAEGILAAIARLRPVETTRLQVERRRWMPGRVLAGLTNIDIAPATVLKLGYGIDAATIPPADLVVSTGGNTLAANIAAAKLLGAPNIFYGRIRRFRPSNFSLVLTSYGGHASLPRHKLTPLMPSPFDPEVLASRSGAQTFGLLIGGNSGGCRFRPEDWRRLFAFVRDMHAQNGTRWVVANSRRTPNSVSDEIARLAGESGAIKEFIDVRTARPGTLARVFAESEAVVATDDSISMISEAVWMRRPVIGVAPAEARFTERESWYRDQLVKNGWTRTMPIADLSPQRVTALFAEITPLTGNPLDLLAETIKQALPTLFAPPA